jgi:hypothetical protein
MTAQAGSITARAEGMPLIQVKGTSPQLSYFGTPDVSSGMLLRRYEWTLRVQPNTFLS